MNMLTTLPLKDAITFRHDRVGSEVGEPGEGGEEVEGGEEGDGRR